MANDEISWGKKMVKISVHFFTDNLPKGADLKTAWEIGAIHMIANNQRGLNHNHVFFNSVKEIPEKMQELLDKNKVTLLKAPKKFEKVRLV